MDTYDFAGSATARVTTDAPAPILRLGLMGLGRIGRNLFRLLAGRHDLELAVICDTADAESLEYLLRYDTLLGRFPSALSHADGWIYACGRRTRLLGTAEPGSVPWGEHGVDVVIEATGHSRSRGDLAGCFAAGVRHVIVCAPPIEPADLTVIFGVNDDQLRPDHQVVSNASPTAQCAAPVLAILDEAFGIEHAFISALRAYSSRERLADVPSADLRSGRAAAENILPQRSNAAEIVMEVLPALRGRLRGAAITVPVPNGSAVDLVCWHRREVDVTAIRECLRTAASTDRWRRVLRFEEAPIVSSDILRSPYSSNFDALATMVLDNRVSKTLSWYDNSWAYACRIVDLASRLAALAGTRP